MTILAPFSRLILAKSGAFSSKEYPKSPDCDEEVLWRAVIDRALHDLGSENPKIQKEAKEWMDICNEDFVEVCRLAGVFPKEVLDFVEKYASVLLDNEKDIVIDITIYLKIRKKENSHGV